ncbi:MAG: glycosyltransferase, partial [Gemmobacter sp.]
GFIRRRADFVRLINENCDVVLGVSRRVCDVAAHFGIRADLLRTSYIGTAQAPKWAETSAKPTILPADGMLTIAYLGYMRMDKGFFFLLDALEDLPDEMAARIRLVICAKRGEQATMRRITALVERFADVLYADGYSHDNLDDLLADVDLGVVPVLWEDNLPQVAIEMHARHIPLLTADMGGAQELADCPAMTFRAGSTDSFTERLAAILAGEVAAADYWARAQAPVSMAAHVDELLAIFRDDPAGMPAPHQVLALPLAEPRRPALKRA